MIAPERERSRCNTTQATSNSRGSLVAIDDGVLAGRPGDADGRVELGGDTMTPDEFADRLIAVLNTSAVTLSVRQQRAVWLAAYELVSASADSVLDLDRIQEPMEPLTAEEVEAIMQGPGCYVCRMAIPSMPHLPGCTRLGKRGAT